LDGLPAMLDLQHRPPYAHLSSLLSSL